METVRLAGNEVSRLILGSNPFSGFSHQGPDRDREMIDFYTAKRIKKVLRQAESLGITTVIARNDHHMTRLLREYWNEGGTLQWIGQSCYELGDPAPLMTRMALQGACAAYVHGGMADNMIAHGNTAPLFAAVETARKAGLPVGMAGHLPQSFEWAEQNLDLDFYMCAYYNPQPRVASGAHDPLAGELYLEEDRRAMTRLIQTLSRPAIHYKVLAAGRNDPAEAIRFAVSQLRENDAVCIGVYLGDDPDMLAQDVALVERALRKRVQV